MTNRIYLVYGQEIKRMLVEGFPGEVIGKECGNVSRQTISQIKIRYWPDSVFPSEGFFITKDAIFLVGVGIDRFWRIVHDVNIQPTHIFPKRKIWSLESLRWIWLASKLCQRCKDILPDGYKGYLCEKCRRKRRSESWLNCYTKRKRKNPIYCIGCKADLRGKHKRQYCEDCSPKKRKNERKVEDENCRG